MMLPSSRSIKDEKPQWKLLRFEMETSCMSKHHSGLDKCCFKGSQFKPLVATTILINHTKIKDLLRVEVLKLWLNFFVYLPYFFFSLFLLFKPNIKSTIVKSLAIDTIIIKLCINYVVTFILLFSKFVANFCISYLLKINYQNE